VITDRSLSIPHGTDTVAVELTVKEAMALGQLVRFHADCGVASTARTKVIRALEQKLLPQAAKVDYFALDL
jgi:hypothetical protein